MPDFFMINGHAAITSSTAGNPAGVRGELFQEFATSMYQLYLEEARSISAS
jgi:hypothetical protein